MRKYLVESLLACAFAWASPVGAEAQNKGNETEVPAEKVGAPLFDNLGNHQHAITTKSPETQRYFNQGLMLAYGFNHAEAIRSFKEAARLDPGCAMAHWGVAWALGPNINAPMSEEAGPQAWAALQKARELAPEASEKEQAYINALSRRYAAQPPKDRAKLDLAFADAMREVAGRFPDDLDATTIFAEALMDTMPWNYWTEKKEPRPRTRELLAALHSVLERDPNHAGANHLYIHAVEAGPNPENGLPSAYRLETLVPGAGHLVHMPSHIYLKVGFYHLASVINERAAEADEEYIATCRRQGFYPGLYYAHNVHFLWYATAMEGRSADAIAAARKVSGYVTHCAPEAVTASRQNPLPVLTLARFKHWDEVLREPLPPPDQLFETGMFHCARGLAFAAKHQLDDAGRELAGLRKICADEKTRALDTIYLPATSVLAIAGHELAGAIAARRGQMEEAAREYRAAIGGQDALPYMEPPFYHYPVRQAFGMALLEHGRAAEAEEVFAEDLKRVPHNGWSLFGLAESLRKQGREKEAAGVESRFREAWKYADVKLQPSLF